MITPKSLWDDMLKNLQSTINATSYDVWIKNLVAAEIVQNKLILLAHLSATAELVNKYYIEKITEAVKALDIFVTEVEVRFEGDYVRQQNEVVEEETATEPEFGMKLIERYTFDSFVVGDSNKFVYAAAKAVAENPGERYNPLFIYGGVGLGKTHVMHAVGNDLKKRGGLNLVYITAEKFTNDFIDALRSPNRKEMPKFKEKYRSADVLMIDDVQFFENKQSVQEELFYTFDTLHNAKKQIILTSDRMPKDIPSLEERLRTRFEWGIIADVQPPSIETKVAILQMKAEQEMCNVPTDVMYLIAERSEANIREMESLLSRVILYSKMLCQEIDMNLAKESLKDYITHRKSQMSADTIIDAVCKYFNITKEEITSKKKTKELVEPRHIAIYLVLEFLSLPLASIGQIFGGRDYTTVIHARDKITDRLKVEKKLAIQLNDIRNMVQSN